VVSFRAEKQDDYFINFRMMLLDLVGHQDVADCLLDGDVAEVIDLLQPGDNYRTVWCFQEGSADGETVCGVASIADVCLGVGFHIFPLAEDDAFLESRRLDENGEVDAGIAQASASMFSEFRFFM
jgi:hypothetical protein